MKILGLSNRRYTKYGNFLLRNIQNEPSKARAKMIELYLKLNNISQVARNIKT